MARSYLRNLTREPLLSTAWTRETVRQKGLSGQEPRSSVSKIMRRKQRDCRTPLLITSALTVPNGSLAASTNFLSSLRAWQGEGVLFRSGQELPRQKVAPGNGHRNRCMAASDEWDRGGRGGAALQYKAFEVLFCFDWKGKSRSGH